MTAEELQVSEVLDREALARQIQERLSRLKNYKPYITISREPGSGGKPIAELVAKRLGFKLYDKTITNEVAAKLKKSPKIIRKVDERERTGVMDFVQNLFNPDYVSDESYFRNLYQVILNRVQKGSVVIVGRGANFIAPKAYGLQVQVVAPYRVRVARAIEYEKIDYYTARERIRHVTAQREGFVRQYFGKDIRAPQHYDLTINTTFLTVEQAADIVIKAYYAKFPEMSDEIFIGQPASL